jgi:hypothetical protein
MSDPNASDGADSVTETSSQGILARLGQSLIGTLIGAVAILASVILLYWNEGRAVAASQGLAQGQRATVEASAAAIDPKSEGGLVRVSGLMTTTAPAADPLFGVTGDGLLRLQRTVQMFQWKEDTSSRSQTAVGGTKTTETTYTYGKAWSDGAIDSTHFHSPDGHQNPPMLLRTATFNSPAASLGAYRIDPGLLNAITDFTPFQAQLNASTAAVFHPDGDGFYRGQSSATPAVGDIRASFTAVPAQTMTVVAGQASGMLAPYQAGDGYQIALAKPGVRSIAEMFREKKAEESHLTWILRAVGVVAMLVGFLLVLGPFPVLASIIPFLGGVAEAGIFVVALTLTVPLALFTVAVAWIAHRPVLGMALFVAGIAVIWLMRRLHKPSAQAAAQRP